MKWGASQPRSAYARAIALATRIVASASTRAMALPPNPPPVMRAPWAPAKRAAATATSSSGQLTS